MMGRALEALRNWRPTLALPRPTIRLRLTLLYGGLVLVSGAVLLTVTYILVSQNTSGAVFRTSGGGLSVTVESSGQVSVITAAPPGSGPPVSINGGAAGGPLPQQLETLAGRLTTLASQQRNDQLNQLLIQGGIALGGMAVLSIALGWLIAGRVLRPLRTITSAAQSITASDLHRRLQLRGPNDELKELGNTVDGLLARLEQAFKAQRQFIANASHELRTPLARQRTVAEVALRDPSPTIESLRASYERVLAAGEQEERILESLLTLARSERGLDYQESCDLAAIADEVLLTRQPEIEQRGLHLDRALGSGCLLGDSRLLERLVSNLVDNAVRYNVQDGRIAVVTRMTGDHVVLWVTNTGAVVPPTDVERLFQPFQRMGDARTARADGVGLGLSIVKSIALAHGALITPHAPAGGGLEIEVTFPSPRVLTGTGGQPR